jgi:hypothetical protein
MCNLPCWWRPVARSAPSASSDSNRVPLRHLSLIQPVNARTQLARGSAGKPCSPSFSSRNLSVEELTAVQASIKMLLQSKAQTAGHAARTPSSSSIRRVQPIVTRRRLVVADAASKDTAAVSVMEKGELCVFPEQPAVYAVYDKDGAVQYIGLTRKVRFVIISERPCRGD